MPISISSLIYALNYVSIHQCTDSNYGFKHKKRFETAIITVSNHYFLYGAGNRARTCDLRVTSALHYHCAKSAYRLPIRIAFFSKIVKQQFVADNMRFVAAKNTTFDCSYQFAIESVNDPHH